MIAQLEMVGVDAVLPVAFVLDLSACGNWPDKNLVGPTMRTSTKTIPVHLAVALAQRQRPYPTVIAERSRLFADVVEQVLLYVAQFPLQDLPSLFRGQKLPSSRNYKD